MILARLAMRTALVALVALPCVLPASGAILGAHRALTAAPRFVSIPAPTQAVDFGVHLPLRNEAQLEQLVNLQSDPTSPLFRHWLTPAQFRTYFGPAPELVQRVSAMLRAQGFTITKVDTQLLHVRGTVATVQRAFDVHLGNVRERDGRMALASREQLNVPAELAASRATVVNLGYRIRPQSQLKTRPLPLNRYSPVGPYWFDDLKQAYNYPAYPQLDGAGMTIATVGYSDFSSKDVAKYFGYELLGHSKTDLAPAPVPQHLVFPDSLPFSTSDGDSLEADVDVQQANGSALGATVIGVAIPALEAEDFLFAYSYLIDNNIPDIVSTSYGECELFYTAAYNFGQSYVDVLLSYHDMFLQGNSQGITFVNGSGDDSGKPCPQPGYLLYPGTGKPYYDEPGTSSWSDDPNVTSVGGTNLKTVSTPGAPPPANLSSAYVSEEAIADRILSPIDPFGTGNLIVNARWGSGGGPSTIFKAPSYQRFADTGSTMRVDPDVSMQMGGCPLYIDPITGEPAKEACLPEDSASVTVFGGALYAVIGTSLSAPEFAGLLAIKEQQEGGERFGNANVFLYNVARYEAENHAYHQGIPGNNGVVNIPRGAPGYNEIVGLGTPDGLNFLGVTKAIPAGDPQTPTNP